MEAEERICTQGHGSIDPSYLVIHDTDDPGADADRLWRYWDSPEGRAKGYQVHYAVDWRGHLVHAVPDDRKAWHCGHGNYKSIGIEICVPTDPADYPSAWSYAVEAARTVLDRHGWGTERMVSHKYASDVWGGSDHQDPIAFFAQMGHTWDEFVEAVGGAPQARAAAGQAAEETRSKKMECILTDINGVNVWAYFDGHDIHDLTDTDDIEVLDKVYRACYGQDMPRLQLGSKDAPWASRLYQVTSAGAPVGLVPSLDDFAPRSGTEAAKIAGLEAAVDALAKAQGADPDAIAKAVSDAVSAKLESLKITVE